MIKKIRTVLIWPLVGAIRLYQRYISAAFPACCRYYPSCSNYALQSLQRHGLFKGLLLATWRLLRCNPWSKGGVDHVPEPGKWKAPQWVPPSDWVGYDLRKRKNRCG